MIYTFGEQGRWDPTPTPRYTLTLYAPRYRLSIPFRYAIWVIPVLLPTLRLRVWVVDFSGCHAHTAPHHIPRCLLRCHDYVAFRFLPLPLPRFRIRFHRCGLRTCLRTTTHRTGYLRLFCYHTSCLVRLPHHASPHTYTLPLTHFTAPDYTVYLLPYVLHGAGHLPNACRYGSLPNYDDYYITDVITLR